MMQVFFGVLAGAIAFIGCAAAQDAKAPPSAFDFNSTPAYSNVVMSPSGRYFAAVYSETKSECLNMYGQVSGKTDCAERYRRFTPGYKIVLYDMNSKATAKALPMPDNHYVQWVEWANDDRVLAGIARRTTVGSKGTRYSIGGSRIISFSRSKDEIFMLFEGSNAIERSNLYMSEVTNILRSDPDHIIVPAYLGGDLDLFKVNVNNGEFERVAVGASGTFDWYTDENGKPIMRFDSNTYGTKVTVLVWSDETESWEKIRTFKLKKRGEEKEDFDFYPVAPGPGPGQLYVRSDEETDARSTIKLFDYNQNKYLETVFEHERYDVSGAIIDYKTGKYAGAYYYADRLEQVFLDKKTQAHYKGINKFFENSANIDFLGFDASGEKSIVFVSGPDIPGEYYLYDIKAANLSPILARNPELHARGLGKTEILNIATRDGKSITGYLTAPPRTGDKPAPLIVMPHGGPEVRDVVNFDAMEQFFVTRGYQVLKVNFRGSWGYGRAFAEAGYGQWGGVMQNDVTDAVLFLHKTGRATADKTCIVGFSYGGYAALYGAASTPELYRCVIAGSADNDLVAAMNEIKKQYGADSETYEYWLKSIGDPKKDEAKLYAVSPIRMIDRIRAPVLLIHGDQDTIVNVKQSQRMNEALKAAGKPVEYLELKDEGHGDFELEKEIEVYEKMEAFLAAHL